jgi:hypothetical protein
MAQSCWSSVRERQGWTARPLSRASRQHRAASIRIAGTAVASGAGGGKWRVMLDPSCAVPSSLVANYSQLVDDDRDSGKTE